MADRKDYYFKQKVTEAELDAGFSGLEDADRAMVTDMGLSGVTLGSVVQRGAGANVSVDLNAHLAYDDSGQRVFIPSTVNQPVASDYLSASTDVAVAGRSKILSVFLVFQRNLSDPRLDGNSVSVFFDRAESYAVVIKQGAEAISPTAPPLEAGKILICDITRTFGQTQILNANISFARRQDMFRLAPSGSIALTAGTAKAIAQALQDTLNTHITGAAGAHAATAISYAGGPAWRDSTTNPAATVEAQLDKIVTDLGDPSVNGSARISSLSVSGVNVLLAAGSARSQIASLCAQLDTLWTQIIATTLGASGAGFVGADASGSLPSGTVRSQLTALDARSVNGQAQNWAERSTITGASTIQNTTVPFCFDGSGNSGISGGGRWIAFDANGTPYTSNDATAWLARTFVSFTGAPAAMATGLIGGVQGFLVTDSATGSPKKSTNGGITWSSVSGVINVGLSICYAASIGTWVMGGFGQIQSSTDGTTWSSRTVPANWTAGNNKHITRIAWNGSIFVAMTTDSIGTVLTSPDGTTWTERAVGITTPWKALAWGSFDGLWLLSDGSNVYKSPDGITWTNCSPSGNRALVDLAVNGPLWVGPNSGGFYGGVSYSTDKGATWKTVDVGSHDTALVGYPSILFADSRFVMARSGTSILEFVLTRR